MDTVEWGLSGSGTAFANHCKIGKNQNESHYLQSAILYLGYEILPCAYPCHSIAHKYLNANLILSSKQ